jgi:hypothetical protein
MFNWLKNKFFVGPEYDPEIEALIERYEAEMLAKEQLKFMQFTIALSNSLFPGDNSAVDRVEKAIQDALGVVAE